MKGFMHGPTKQLQDIGCIHLMHPNKSLTTTYITYWYLRVNTPTLLIHVRVLFVGSCLATKVFIGNLPAMGRDWVIIK